MRFMEKDILTKRIRVYGIVQGVGFRPTVARHAHAAGVTGQVANKGPYVEIYARGNEAQLDHFLDLVEHEAPSRAVILKVDVKDVPGTADSTIRYDDFRIVESARTTGEIYIPPDIAICDDCKRELFDPANRRYLHPFINCTVCGPRLTIIDGLPYDRERTSMKMFPMCPDCAREYHDPKSRRYDAQPVCCPHCGPEVYLLSTSGHPQAAEQRQQAGLPGKKSSQTELPAGRPAGSSETDTGVLAAGSNTPERIAGSSAAPEGERAQLRGHTAISEARRVIADGGIVAVKGIGGFHLCCDATNAAAVERLRRLKNRPQKPFAVMMRDETVAERVCRISPAQMEILTGHQKPILLLPKRERTCGDPEGKGLCEAVAPDNPFVGVMLPYAPIQLLLFRYDDGIVMPDMLVMTSGNVSGAPIARTDEDALTQLSGFCDCILSNNRPIRVRADDSVMDFYDNAPYMIRRSRGYAPLPYIMSRPMQGQVLAIGGELKNTFCIGVNSLLYPSSYVGDLADVRTQEALTDSVELMESLLETRPEVIAADLHPGYQSTRVARDYGTQYQVPVVLVQHHYAHILSCMAENDCMERCIGISLDGTGYGTDGTIWGGEVLLADADGFTREASIAPFLQIGGDISSKEGWRIAVSMLCGLYQNQWSDLMQTIGELGLCDAATAKIQHLMHEKKLNAIRSTSCGRLFDAVAAILGIRRASTFEGEASNALMFRALEYEERPARERESADIPENLKACLDTSIWKQASDGRCLMPTDALVAWIVSERLHWLEESARGGTAEAVTRTESNAMDTSCGTSSRSSAMVSGETTPRQTKRGYDENAQRLAYLFHVALAQMVTEAALEVRKKTSVNVVALSGGCYQNRLLLSLTDERLRAAGFRVLRHHLVPPNDGGICLGQALYAMNWLQKNRR